MDQTKNDSSKGQHLLIVQRRENDLVDLFVWPIRTLCSPRDLLHTQTWKMPKIDSLDALGDAMTTILTTILTTIYRCEICGRKEGKSPKNVPKLVPRNAHDMPMICPRYAQDKPQVCSRYAQGMSKVCPRYALDMPKICPRYAIPMSILTTDLEQTLEICKRFWENHQNPPDLSYCNITL